MVAGLGIDILEVARMERELRREGYGMRDVVFTPAEVADSQKARRPAHHLAACFAAKEGLFKALGTGWSDGLSWQEVEVSYDGCGSTMLALSGKAKEAADHLGVSKVWVSMSGTKHLVIASVVLENQEESHLRSGNR